MYQKSGADRRKVFPAGLEGQKAFPIDAVHKFTSGDRNAKSDDYEVVMFVRLSPQLKTYLINFLSTNVDNPFWGCGQPPPPARINYAGADQPQRNVTGVTG